MVGGGSQRLSTVFAPDLAAALVAAGRSEAVGQTLYPCHPETTTTRELAEAIGVAIGRRLRILSLPRASVAMLMTLSEVVARLQGRATIWNRDKTRELLAPAWTADPRQLTEETGWAAAHDLRTGLGETVRRLRQAIGP